MIHKMKLPLNESPAPRNFPQRGVDGEITFQVHCRATLRHQPAAVHQIGARPHRHGETYIKHRRHDPPPMLTNFSPSCRIFHFILQVNYLNLILWCARGDKLHPRGLAVSGGANLFAAQKNRGRGFCACRFQSSSRSKVATKPPANRCKAGLIKGMPGKSKSSRRCERGRSRLQNHQRTSKENPGRNAQLIVCGELAD